MPRPVTTTVLTTKVYDDLESLWVGLRCLQDLDASLERPWTVKLVEEVDENNVASQYVTLEPAGRSWRR